MMLEQDNIVSSYNQMKCDVATTTEDDLQPENNLTLIEQLGKCLKEEFRTVQTLHNKTIQMLLQIEVDKINLKQSSEALDEERKKLVKKEEVFKKYIENMFNKKNKNELEQKIAQLKKQLSMLQEETQKLKKYGNTVTELQLLKENENLKLKVKNLLIENSKLMASQRFPKKQFDTKLLQEVDISTRAVVPIKRSKINPAKQTKQKEVNQNNDNNWVAKLNKSYDISNLRTQLYHSKDITSNSDRDCTEEINPETTKRVIYSKGCIKTISAEGNMIKIQYPSGRTEVKNLLDCTICYFSTADGVKTLKHQDWQRGTRFKHDTSLVRFPDNEIIVLYNSQGEKTLILPNGEKRIYAKDHTRYEYPDGIVKLFYGDGRQETRFTNGWVRINDKQDVIIFDGVPTVKYD